ncbi:hypothetical protein [Nocardia sp. AG03]|uniref:hypothetical protein n=1 Tax=Nocardia sp. AG03 TaxID=3025312 RepID=UPI0024184BCC|nr:hypothetical protein [Nocardia sp. AG03]
MTPDNSASALTEEDLNELHEEYSDYLIESAPTGWTRIRYTIYSTIDHHAYKSVAITDQSSEIPLFPSPELIELFHTLRTSMFEPGKGTWLAAVYEFDQDGDYNFAFDYDSKLPVEMGLSPDDYARDFEHFPRDTSNLPKWLIDELDSANHEPGWYLSPNAENVRRDPQPVDFTINIVEDDAERDPDSIRTFVSTGYTIHPAEPCSTAHSIAPWHDDPYRDNAVLENIGRHLQQGVPNGWHSLTYTYREAGLCRHGTLEYTNAVGARSRILRPLTVQDKRVAVHEGRRDYAEWSEEPLHELWSQHRRSSYQPGRGTWFTAKYSLDTSGRFNVEYSYDEQPEFIPRLSVGMYAYDLQVFPRDSSRTPPWLSEAVTIADTNPDRLL